VGYFTGWCIKIVFKRIGFNILYFILLLKMWFIVGLQIFKKCSPRGYNYSPVSAPDTFSDTTPAAESAPRAFPSTQSALDPVQSFFVYLSEVIGQ